VCVSKQAASEAVGQQERAISTALSEQNTRLTHLIRRRPTPQSAQEQPIRHTEPRPEGRVGYADELHPERERLERLGRHEVDHRRELPSASSCITDAQPRRTRSWAPLIDRLTFSIVRSRISSFDRSWISLSLNAGCRAIWRQHSVERSIAPGQIIHPPIGLGAVWRASVIPTEAQP